MIVQRKGLLDVCTKALAGTSTNSALDGANALIFDGGFVSSFNETISITCKLPEDCAELSGAISAKEFCDLLSKLEEDEITIFVKENMWKVRTTKAKIELVKIEKYSMEVIKSITPKDFEWIPVTTSFLECCSMALFSKNSSKLAGVYFNNEHVVSTDEMRINFFKSDVNFDDDFWLDENAVKEMLKIEGISKISIGKSWVHFFSSENELVFSCKKVSGDYPFEFIKKRIDLHKKEPTDVQGKLPKELLQAMNRAFAFCQSIDSYLAIKLTFSTSGVQIYSEQVYGKYDEEVEWETPLENPIEKPVSILLDFRMMKASLGDYESFYIKNIEYAHGNMNTMVFECANGVQLLGSIEE